MTAVTELVPPELVAARQRGLAAVGATRRTSWGRRQGQERRRVAAFVSTRQVHGTLQVLGIMELDVDPDVV
jgi:hypothetical protein